MRAAGVRGAIGVLVVLAFLLGMPVTGTAQPPPPDESGVAPGVQVPDPRPDDAFADPQVAALQRQAADVQTELAGLQDRVRSVQSELDLARAELAAARGVRARADATAVSYTHLTLPTKRIV